MGFRLQRPENVGAAIELARELGPEARYLAGGTDLIIQINRRRCTPSDLIALDRIAELSGIDERGDAVDIGALTTMKAIECDARFTGRLGALGEAARVVGGHQIRNVATIGGNVANASPAADLLPVLLALEAEVEICGAERTRRIPLAGLLRGPGVTDLERGELLRRVSFGMPSANSATAFVKAGRRQAMEISIVCVAAFLALDENGRVRDVRIALGAVAPTAMRATPAEATLRGGEPSAAALQAAGAAAAAHCAPISDVRASAWYRRQLVATLVPRALERCRQRVVAGSA
jgi:probable selenate reductase FAD-binding subunit